MTRVLGTDAGLASFGYCVVEFLPKPIPRPGDLFGGDIYEQLLDAGVIETENAKSTKVRKCDDEMRRMREQTEELLAIARENPGIRAICAEARSAIHVPGIEVTALASQPVEPARVRAVAGELLARLRGDAPPTEDEVFGRLLELVPRGPTSAQVDQIASDHTGRTYGLIKASIMLALSWGVLAAVAGVLDVPVVQTSPQAMKKKLCGRTSASKQQVYDALEKRYGKTWLHPIASLNAGRRFHASDSLATVVAALDHDVLRLARRTVVDSARVAEEGDIDFG